ncbi:transcriptional regulator [Paenibacillus vortex V453]|uniref:Transcriptional regulator n=1 Tax=Paenibacillus vortex V453 TaxID=715225 RepID=A0A2R9T2D7_9BACL|nr:hypothetical protein [Paenibacillus vortex]EFU43835.1 transcriptional regulator [Paenibacillus vortex V453]
MSFFGIAPYIGTYQMRVVAYLGVASKLLDWLLEEKVEIIIMSQKLTAPGTRIYPVHAGGVCVGGTS